MRKFFLFTFLTCLISSLAFGMNQHEEKEKTITFESCVSLISALNKHEVQYAVGGSVAKKLRGLLGKDYQPHDLDLLIAGLAQGKVGAALEQLIPGLKIITTEADSVQAFRGTIELDGHQLEVDVIRAINKAKLQQKSSEVALTKGVNAHCLDKDTLEKGNIWIFSEK